MIDQDISDKVYRECVSSFKITMRRFAMLKKMPKDQRPYNHAEVVASWQEAIEKYKLTNKL